MNDEFGNCRKNALDCICKDVAHHFKNGNFTCFRLEGDSKFILDAPKNMPVLVLVCPFCGENI